MFKISCTILLFLSSLLAIAQTELEKNVCNIDGTDISPDNIRQASLVAKTDELFDYLNQINNLFEQPYARYTLMDIKGIKVAAAHIQLIGDDFARVISINKDYYISRLNKKTNKKALLIWILAHELTHHTNGDLHYDLNGIIANNYKREILADERAGYAVGMLTNVDIDFFDEELPRILGNKVGSPTHPELKYRIISVKAGWLQARLKEQDWLNSCSRIYKKQITEEAEIYGRYYNEGFNGLIIKKLKNNNEYMGECAQGLKNGNGIMFSNDSLGRLCIYLGQWTNDKRNGVGIILITNGDEYRGDWKNDQKSGKGILHLANGDVYAGSWVNDKMDGQGNYSWANGDRYNGNWKAGYRSGYGTQNYTNGTKYRGQWLNNKRHGDGMLYKGKRMLKAGCWQNDIYIGTECN